MTNGGGGASQPSVYPILVPIYTPNSRVYLEDYYKHTLATRFHTMLLFSICTHHAIALSTLRIGKSLLDAPFKEGFVAGKQDTRYHARKHVRHDGLSRLRSSGGCFRGYAYRIRKASA